MFVAAQAFGALALNPLWGWWGDRRGKFSLLRVVAAISVLSPIVAGKEQATGQPPASAIHRLGRATLSPT